MEAVGRLAGGVAHDFNNELTVILGECEMAALELDEDHPLLSSIRLIEDAGNRAAGLTRQLLTFSRKQLVEPTVLNPNELVVEMDKMLRRLIGEDVEYVTRPAPDLGAVEADRGQLEQVVMNMVVNARDAMPEGGQLVIETANAALDAVNAEAPNGTAREYVMLSVSDTGTGMTDEVKAHLFEPFFTTKGKGRGTGLGLATSYAIVEQLGGRIAVYSEQGIGTTMKIYLPRVREEAMVTHKPEEATPLPRGSETILLVEDEAGVRDIAVSVMERQGYTVLCAKEAEAALCLLEQHDGQVDPRDCSRHCAFAVLTYTATTGMLDSQKSPRLEHVGVRSTCRLLAIRNPSLLFGVLGSCKRCARRIRVV